MNHFQMDRLDQCRKGMCHEAWSIYIDQALKILDQKMETGLKSSASTKNNEKKNDFILIGSEIEKGHKWEVKKSEIDGSETNKNSSQSSDLLQLTRFEVGDFYKVGAHSCFVETKSRYNSYGVYFSAKSIRKNTFSMQSKLSCDALKLSFLH